MLGKRNRRVKLFSTCHAMALAGLIVLSQVLGFGASDRVAGLSDLTHNLGDEPQGHCVTQGAVTGGENFCALLLKATYPSRGQIGIVIVSRGVRL